MIRFGIIVAAGIILLGADLTSRFAVGFGAGILVGAVFFLLGAAKGGLRPVGLAAPHLMPGDLPKHATDPNAGIGCGLAASGIASSVVSNMHFPLPFRIFYAFCIGAGLVIALGLAWRWRNRSHTPSPPLE